jgi:hypothetical protein
MEHKFTNLSDEEIVKLNPQELNNLIEEIRDSYDKLNAMSYEIAAKKMAEIVCGYDIETVGLDPHYEYCDEGFAGTYMVTINHEDVSYDEEEVNRYSKSAKKISYSGLQERIDNEMDSIRFLINEEMSFDVNALRAKYGYVEKTTPKKTGGKTYSRYKL